MTPAGGVPADVPPASPDTGARAPQNAAPTSSAAVTTSANPSRKSRTRGPGRARLLQLADALSERDRAVLGSIDAHRYATTRHLAAWHFADHASAATGLRVCRRVLTRLHGHGLVDHLAQRVGGVRSGSSGVVWHLAPAGDRMLSTLRPGRRGRRESEPSRLLLRHYLAACDAHVLVVEASRHGRFEIERVELEPDCWRRFTDLHGSHLVRPDLGLVTGDACYLYHWALEVDLGTERPARLIEKCRLYERYAASLDGDSEHVAPVVVWIMDSPERVAALEAALSRAPEVDPARYRITTMAGLVEVLASEPGRVADPDTDPRKRPEWTISLFNIPIGKRKNWK